MENRPDWVWRHPRVVAQREHMHTLAGYDLWRSGVDCPEAAAYDREDRRLGQILDEVFSSGHAAHEAALVAEGEKRGEIHLSHKLSDGRVLKACVFTAPHMIKGQPVLRGALCVGDQWWSYVPSSWFLTDEPDYGMVQRPIPIGKKWTCVSKTTETHVYAPSRSEAIRIMRTAAVTELNRFVATHVEPRLQRDREAAAKKATEAALMAAWSAS